MQSRDAVFHPNRSRSFSAGIEAATPPEQVFRLPDHPTGRAFPSYRTVAFRGFRSRLRRRVRDGFSPSSL
ncbi:hypothetical protein TRIP_B220063 [uncultured Desulfatiglans sp.]|nr:hypothetical protein TRIP_B220063 [uncultured Desulfatiglans sp.]